MGLEAIRGIMMRKGFTSEKLAEVSGVPKSTIDKIASGVTDNPRYKSLKAMVDGLGMGIDDLLAVIGGVTISDADREMLMMFHSMNPDGKLLVRQLVRDMLDSGNYRERGGIVLHGNVTYTNAAAAMEGTIAKVNRTEQDIQAIEQAGKEFFDAQESDL